MSGTDPSVLSTPKLLMLVAEILEQHEVNIFVHKGQGRALIAELRKRAGATMPPVSESIDLPPGTGRWRGP